MSHEELDRRLMDEIGCADGCPCLTPAVRLAEDAIKRVAELEAALREIHVAAVRVGDGETREALEHCAVTAMDVTTRVLRDLEYGEHQTQPKQG